jgi:hypothetical protein
MLEMSETLDGVDMGGTQAEEGHWHVGESIVHGKFLQVKNALSAPRSRGDRPEVQEEFAPMRQTTWWGSRK